MIQNAEILAQQIADYPNEILTLLSPSERENLLGDLDSILDRTERANSHADLIEIAESIYHLVESRPKLHSLFFEDNFDVNKAQLKRKVSLADHEALSGVDQYTQKRAIQIKNSVLECREQLLESIGDIGIQTQETEDNVGDPT